jgi:hypothetical protein
MSREIWSINTWWKWALYVIEFLQHPPRCDWRLKACYIYVESQYAESHVYNKVNL